jgi:phage/plasmid-like protein (TIGR03299 family)
MAHEIDKSNGKENFVSYKQKAWHGLGTVLQETLTIEDALKYGGLDFDVHKLPNTHNIPYVTESGLKAKMKVESTNSFFTYRDDTLAVLGDKLGKDYTVLQNFEALGILDIVLENNTGMILETAGSLKGGSTVFVTAKMPNNIIVGKDDEVEQYLVASNSHDGSSAVRVMFTPVRVVCQNTLTMAIKGANKHHSIRHTGNVKENFQQALKVLGLATENKEIAEQAFNQMAKTQLRKDEFWNYLGNVFFTEQECKDIKKGIAKEDVLSPQKIKLIDNVMEYSHSGVGQQEANEMSSWWAYNGVTGFLSNEKKFKDAEKRFDNLLVSTSVQDKALSLALNPSFITSLKASSNYQLSSN